MPSAPKAPTPKAPEVKVGDLILDRYRVVEQIASGGHSVVYRGQDERLSRPVCIKVFSGLGGKSGLGRTSYEHFVQEAFALSRLTHPNTLRIYDFGHLGSKEAAGMPLQVCEYMNGGTLSNIIREQGKQPLAETVRVIGAMCSALSEAHQLGIVHRDIKPQNILFGSVGGNRLPKLADFGIAKWSGEDEKAKEQRAEDTAIVAGQKLAMYSPSWAAPEQLAGQPVSPSTDIYSLACVAIYMMSGKAIFADEDVYAGYKKRRHADELVRETLGPLKTPRVVIDVLIKALAFDPKKRLTKVDELSNELQTALEPMTEEQPRLTPKKSMTAQMGAEPNPQSPPSRKTPGSVKSPTMPPDVKPQTEATAPLASAPKRQTERGHSAEGEEAEAMPPPPSAQFPAPGPGPAPAADLTPQTYYAGLQVKPGVQAWMQVAPSPAPHAQARRLALMDVPQPIGDRRIHFQLITDRIDLAGLHGTKVRITLLPGPTGNRVVHVKGMTCFVSPVGGRPSPALHIDRSTDIALVTPRAQEIGHLRVLQGTPDGAQNMFYVGAEVVAVGIEDCGDPILFDFGPGSDAYIVYTRGRTVPKSGRRG
jgi:serine/threonine-protein kinase